MSLALSYQGEDGQAAYAPPVRPWAHQREALARMADLPAFALFMDMRTGKTKVILDEWGAMVSSGQVEQLLVVAPAGVYRTWEGAAREHLDPSLLRASTLVTWSARDSERATERTRSILGSREGPKILLVNVEALSKVERARELCSLFLARAPTTLVVDESTTIKDHKAKRTKFCLLLARRAKVRRILSGLPSPQSPLDLYSQFCFLDPSIVGTSTFAGFRGRYARMKRVPFGPGGRWIDIVDGYQNLEDLQSRISPFSFRVRLDECYDLPPKMYLRRDVDMTEEQRKIYREMKEFATASLGQAERVTATIVLTQILRLHQVLAGHVRSDSGEEVDVEENKTAEMMRILENHPADRKAIIWAAYDRSVRKIARALTDARGEGSVARFWGGNSSEREEEERRFLKDPRCRFMVATAASGGRGRTWPVADLVIYYSNTHSLEHRLQSEERSQAVGKMRSVAYFDLVCPGTVEEKILEALRAKISLSDAITGDNWREWVV